jgi:TRAP-type C4-dicarboxylate transport system permease small subunit
MSRLRNQPLWWRIASFIEGLSYVTGFLGGVAILAAALIVTEGVVLRKVFRASTIWQIELSVFLLMYACFVGSALGQKNEAHLNVDLAIHNLPPGAKHVLLFAATVLSCLVCGVLMVYSWPMWWEAWIAHEHSESLWGPPLWIPYLFLPLGMTLLFLQHLVTISRRVRQWRSGSIRSSEDEGSLSGSPKEGKGAKP